MKSYNYIAIHLRKAIQSDNLLKLQKCTENQKTALSSLEHRYIEVWQGYGRN